MLTEKELRQLTKAFFDMSKASYPGPRSLIDLDQVMGLLKEYSDVPDFVYEITYEKVNPDMTRRTLVMVHGETKDG